MTDITPEVLFYNFRKTHTLGRNQFGFRALKKFEEVADKAPFLDPAIHFLETEQNDRARAWITNVLEAIGDNKAFDALVKVLDGNAAKPVKRQYIYTRFFALRGVHAMADSSQRASIRDEICHRIQPDDDEDWLVRAGAAAILAKQGDQDAIKWLKKMLANRDNWWAIMRTARALEEFPVDDLAEDLRKIAAKKLVLQKNNQEIANNIDHRWQVIRALAMYPHHPGIIEQLSAIVQDESEYPFIREKAVISLGKLGEPAARDALLIAVQDDNAEIRYQAGLALGSILSPERAASAVVQAALEADIDSDNRNRLVDAMRLVDPSRDAPTEILSRELAAEDRQRADLAEKMLFDLGGRSAVQRLSQRRRTLNRLDNLLSQSEKVVHDTFESTIRQASFNFYFAMGVNMLIVITGIALVILAILQLIQNPQNLTSWILPGATGVLGVLINLTFNNPRHNARNDLAALLNVTVIFLGYLRQLNEIDATFKHAYLENPEFSTAQMRETVEQIEEAVDKTLAMARQHLRYSETGQKKG
jgi:HEAT repeat protein